MNSLQNLQQDRCRKLFLIRQIKWSLEQLQHICNELRDEKEIDIMKKCGDKSRRYTILLLCKRIYIDI